MALSQLPDAQQKIMVELYVHGKSSDEVAQTLGMNADNTRIIAHRAASHISQALAYHYHMDFSARAIRLCLGQLQDLFCHEPEVEMSIS